VHCILKFMKTKIILEEEIPYGFTQYNYEDPETPSQILMKELYLEKIEANQILDVLRSVVEKFNQSFDPSHYCPDQNSIGFTFWEYQISLSEEDSKRLDQFISPNLIDLPELKEVWFNIKVALLNLEQISWEKLQNRKKKTNTTQRHSEDLLQSRIILLGTCLPSPLTTTSKRNSLKNLKLSPTHLLWSIYIYIFSPIRKED